MIFLPVVIGDAATRARSMGEAAAPGSGQQSNGSMQDANIPLQLPGVTSMALWGSLGLHSQRKEGVECFNKMTSLV